MVCHFIISFRMSVTIPDIQGKKTTVFGSGKQPNNYDKQVTLDAKFFEQTRFQSLSSQRKALYVTIKREKV